MIEPIALKIFGISIHWYGLIYVFSFCFAWWFVLKFFKDFDINIPKDKVENIIIFTMIGGVLGARLIYSIIYSPSHYISNPFDIIRIDKGGMSVFGGILGGVISLFYFSKKYNVPFLKLTDLFSIPLILGLTFGRFGNYINQELVGIATKSSLGVVFPLFDSQKRLPYQLFASAKNLVVFHILLYLKFFNKVKKTGTLTLLFLGLFSFGRFVLDFLRYEPEAMLWGLNKGQWLSIICIIFVVIMITKNEKKRDYDKVKHSNKIKK